MIDLIVSGIAVGSFTGLLGYVIGSKDKLSTGNFNKICCERQAACANLVTAELDHIKNDQKEMKADIKTILKNQK